MLAEDLFNTLYCQQSFAVYAFIIEAFLDEGLSIDRLSDSNSFWDVNAIEVIIEKFSVNSEIRFFYHCSINHIRKINII